MIGIYVWQALSTWKKHHSIVEVVFSTSYLPPTKLYPKSVAILAWNFWWGNFVWRHVTITEIDVADYYKQ